MPRHAKSTKTLRDRRMLAGLKKHALTLNPPDSGAMLQSTASLAALLQAHLDAMDEVTAKEAAWRSALHEEERLEEEVKKRVTDAKLLMRSVFGDTSLALLDFGIAPRKKIKLGVEKMLRTIEKRNATRKARGTMGKRQRLSLRRGT